MSSPAAKPYAVLAVVAVGTLMAALGSSLINVAVPLVRRDLGADIGAASWVLAAYSLSVSALLLPFGRVGDRHGKGRVYTVGFGVFGVGSALSALAPTLAALVAARAFQGAGAAMLMANGPALTTAAFPPAQRGRALGLQATATYLGLSLGPSIGGWLAQAAGWHVVFWINVPISVAGALLARSLVWGGAAGAPLAAGRARPFPWASALLFGPALSALLVAVTRGQSWGFWSPRFVFLLVLGVVLAAAFVRVERRSPAPLLSAALLREPAFASGLAAAFVQYAAVYMLMFLLPFYLQGPLAMSAAEAGVVMTVQPAAMALITFGSGWLSDRVGTRGPAVAGIAVLAIGLASVALLGSEPERASVLAALSLVGLGSGLFTSPNNSRIMGAAPREQQGTAAGLLAEARNVGMLCGVAASGAVFAALGGGRPGEGGGAFGAAFQGTILAAAVLAGLGVLASAAPPRAATAPPSR
ncbi:multidrug MFS transporter [Sorangium cellulosum]|uniref:Multidrug MFS transporter n=1 Tax=Sorangium cellulosum TaxID=56 RepID=A0A2L0EMP1_SORCE|nr:MFS transporter [Sorangium cellulosum]AUX40571.1 multidrug MFS transporter [Sorangium cellulosum]